MDVSIILLFCSTVTILTLSPGPDIIFVISQSLQRGYKYGVKISLGLVTGLFIYTIASSFGLSWVLDQFPNVSSLIKIVGAFYIGFLAYEEFPKKGIIKLKEPINNKNNPFFTGLIMNLSNPKIMLFFVSLFPQFVFHNNWPIKYQFLILGIVFIIIAFLIFSLVSVLSYFLIKKTFSNFNHKYFSYSSCFVLGSISVLLFVSEIKNIFE
jgi:threonine/homoserine/homoserine lactone efflux protein